MDLSSGSEALVLPMMNVLPIDCISRIVSLTSPKNACVSAMVSSDWLIAANADSVWEQFLPSNYQDILSRALVPIPFSSKKDLYFHLCNPILIDGGQSSISLEKTTGKICYMISAEELVVTDSMRLFMWTWSTVPYSRFGSVAGPMPWDLFQFEARVRSSSLSPNTTYDVYVVYKIIGDVVKEFLKAQANSPLVDDVVCYTEMGPIDDMEPFVNDVSFEMDPIDDVMELHCVPFSVESINQALLSIKEDGEIDLLRADVESFWPRRQFKEFAIERKDHWMEHRMGEFLNLDADSEKFIYINRCRRISHGGWFVSSTGKDLIIEGVEFRPTN